MAPAFKPPLAWLWENRALSDVTLQLSTVQTVSIPAAPTRTVLVPPCQSYVRPEEAPVATATDLLFEQDSFTRTHKLDPPGNSSSEQQQATACSDSSDDAVPTVSTELVQPARILRCHAVVLASASSYFKARIMRCSGSGSGEAPFACDASTSESSTGMTLLEHVEEGELESMEAMLRFCYTGELCAPDGRIEELGTSHVLKMLGLSDRYAGKAAAYLQDAHSMTSKVIDLAAWMVTASPPSTAASLQVLYIFILTRQSLLLDSTLQGTKPH